jgi:hypothetical protein
MSKPKFTLIKTPSKQEQKLIDVAHKKTKISVLCRSLDLKISTTFTGRVDDKLKTFELAYPNNMNIFELKETLNKVKAVEQMLATILIPGEIIGINFHILGFNSDGIVCKFPENLYEINRRASKRWKPSPELSLNLYIEISLPQVSPLPLILPLNDLSIHGLSFKVPSYLKNFFKQGQIFPRINLRMGVKNIPLTMEIRNQFTNNEVKLPLKVGVKFYKIDPFHQVDIQKYIQQNDKKAG